MSFFVTSPKIVYLKLCARILRLTLVFALVFGTSFYCESKIAFAALPNVHVQNAADHTSDTLSDLALYQWDASESQWQPAPYASATSTSPASLSIQVGGGAAYLAAMPIWNANYPMEGGLTQVESLNVTTWDIPASEALEASVDNDTQLLSLEAISEGSLRIECKALDQTLIFSVQAVAADSDSTGSSNDSSSGENANNGSSNDETTQAEPLITSVEIRNTDGEVFTDKSKLQLADAQTQDTYQLYAQVLMSNMPLSLGAELGLDSSSEESETGDFSFDSANDSSLSRFSGGILEDLHWVSSNEEVARVDENGLVSVVGEGSCRIICTAIVIATQQAMPCEIDFVVGEDTAQESELPHPQDSLRIYFSTTSGSQESEGGINSSISKASSDGDDSANDSSSSNVSNGADTEAELSSSAEAKLSTNTEANLPFDDTYSLSQLQEIAARGDIAWRSKQANMKSQGKSIQIRGEGVGLVDLLSYAFGQHNAQFSDLAIESIDLIDYRGIATSFDWSYVLTSDALLSSASALVADESEEFAEDSSEEYANENASSESGDSESGDSESDGSLDDSTRFRLIADTSDVDADALRYIKAIRINVASSDTDSLAVSISYVPVPLGVEAEFVAVPNYDISGLWDCKWEQSTNGGISWELIDGATSQTLRLLTTQERVGTQYRVKIDNRPALNSGDADELLTGTSQPVTMSIGDDFSIVVSYNPPIAGEVAIFRTSVNYYTGSMSDLEYVWEYTTNGGASWSVIKGRNKPTLELETKAIDANSASSGNELGDTDGSSDASDSGDASNSGDSGGASSSSSSAGASTSSNKLILIRARVIAPGDIVRVSNVVPLAVRIGSTDTDSTSGDNDDGRIDGSTGPTGSNSSSQNNGLNSSTGTTRAPGDPGTVTSLVQTIVNENSQTPSGLSSTNDSSNLNQQALDPDGESSIPLAGDIYINDEVSEQILQEQQAALDETAATTPGARWTQLKTINPTADDIQRVLAENPYVPFIVPLTLALFVAGGLEKLLAFRRQIA